MRGGPAVAPRQPRFKLESNIFPYQEGLSLPICAMDVASNCLVLATSNGTVSRLVVWRLDREERSVVEIQHSSRRRVHKVFIDPTGNHIVISLTSDSAGGKAMYLHRGQSKPRDMKMKGSELVESVGWNKYRGTETNTGPILFGTNGGSIYETKVDARDSSFSFNLVHTIGKGLRICGVGFEEFPGSATSQNADKYFVMVATASPTRYYQFVGGPDFARLFASYASPENLKFYELPSHLAFSELHLFARSRQACASSFALLTGVGVCYGSLLFGSQNPGEELVQDPTLCTYTPEEQGNPAISLAVTEFHMMLLYSGDGGGGSRLVVKHKLNERNVFEIALPATRLGALIGLVRDPASNTVWLYSTKAVHQIVIEEEDRDVWLLYLGKAKAGDVREFDTALKFCKTTAQRDEVTTSQADYFFEKRNYDLAAQHYARTRRPFESVALKFVSAQQPNSLATFLLHRLDRLESSEATKRSLLCTWLVELFLESLNDLEERDASARAETARGAGEQAQARFGVGGASASASASASAAQQAAQPSPEYRQRLQEFHQFLRDHAGDLYLPGDHGRTTIALLEEHGRTSGLLVFAQCVGRHELILEHHVQRASYVRAAKALGALLSSPSAAVDFDMELLYRYSPLLVRKVPHLAVEVWETAMSARGLTVDVARLVPSVAEICAGSFGDAGDGSLAARHQGLQNRSGTAVPFGGLGEFLENSARLVTRFLEETCWKRGGDVSESVHNLLVTLHAVRSQKARARAAAAGAAVPTTDVLLAYLDAQADQPCYDVTYALRVCSTAGHRRACVELHSLLGEHSDAVALALKLAPADGVASRADALEIAKKCAKRCVAAGAPEWALRKLWMQIAGFVSGSGGGAESAGATESESEAVAGAGAPSEGDAALKLQRVQQTLRVVDESGLLSVDDVLPVLESFDTIAAVQERVVESLQRHFAHVQDLRSEITDLAMSSERLRAQVDAQKARLGVVHEAQRCDLTGQRLTSHHFHFFPCGHAFLSGALRREMVEHLTPVQRKLLAAKDAEVRRLRKHNPRRTQLAMHDEKRRMEIEDRRRQLVGLEREIDDLIAADCPLCGQVVIDSISQPFISDTEREGGTLAQWDV